MVLFKKEEGKYRKKSKIKRPKKNKEKVHTYLQLTGVLVTIMN